MYISQINSQGSFHESCPFCPPVNYYVFLNDKHEEFTKVNNLPKSLYFQVFIMFTAAYMMDYQNLGCFGQLEHTIFTIPFVVQSTLIHHSFTLLNLVVSSLCRSSSLPSVSPLFALTFLYSHFLFYCYSLLCPQNPPIALFISFLSAPPSSFCPSLSVFPFNRPFLLSAGF